MGFILMSKHDSFDAFIKSFFDTAPKEVAAIQGAVKEHLKISLKQALVRMDLVTREEFDAQSRLLERLSEKCDQLEAVLD